MEGEVEPAREALRELLNGGKIHQYAKDGAYVVRAVVLPAAVFVGTRNDRAAAAKYAVSRATILALRPADSPETQTARSRRNLAFESAGAGFFGPVPPSRFRSRDSVRPEVAVTTRS